MSSDTLCNIYLEEFTQLFSECKLTDACAGCGFIGVRHRRREDAVAAPSRTNGSVLSGIASAFIKLKPQLPEWSKNTECRAFFKKVELVLETNEGIPRSHWCRVFLYIVPDQPALEWIMDNIVKLQLSWEDAKAAFSKHFQSAEYNHMLLLKYDRIKRSISTKLFT